MGFYDEFDRKPKKTSPAKWIAVILVSALVGSGTTMAVLPTLVKRELSQIPATQATTGHFDNSGPTQTVSYQVNSDVVQAVNKVKPAVVGVVNRQKVRDPFNLTEKERAAGVGSGILIDAQGHIVTNNHVVEGASDVQVVIQDNYLAAKVIGTDPVTDLAVIQVDASKVKDITPAQFGNSDKLQIGEPAIAIGNPLGLKFAQTVTTGVISALEREMPMQDEQTGASYTETYLQTDAAINPGNSGGALCNIQGQVIGINSAKISSAGIEGIGFAIPVNSAQPIIQQLIKNGKVIRPMLGVSVRDVSTLPDNYQAAIPNGEGVYVRDANAQAAGQGLKPGDVITKIDGKPVKDLAGLQKLLFAHQVGDTVQVTVFRPGGEKNISVKLQARNS